MRSKHIHFGAEIKNTQSEISLAGTCLKKFQKNQVIKIRQINNNSCGYNCEIVVNTKW